MGKIKEIVILSGKGGTGKTTVAASLAELIHDKIIVDADVDAANMYLLMEPENIKETEFKGKSIANINTSICTSCNLCKELCRFNAIEVINGDYVVEDISCDGCRLCQTACPVDAIEMVEQIVGKWIIADTRFGDFIYARLNPGGENSGNLVAMVKYQSKLIAEEKNISTILIDGPPGIGCPVIASLSGSDYVIVVTEPSFSGINDLKRVLELTKHFRIKTGIVVNKFDINIENTEKIEKFAQENRVEVLAKIPHSFCIIEEISKKSIPSTNCEELKKPVIEIYNKIKDYFEAEMAN